MANMVPNHKIQGISSYKTRDEIANACRQNWDIIDISGELTNYKIVALLENLLVWADVSNKNPNYVLQILERVLGPSIQILTKTDSDIAIYTLINTKDLSTYTKNDVIASFTVHTTLCADVIVFRYNLLGVPAYNGPYHVTGSEGIVKNHEIVENKAIAENNAIVTILQSILGQLTENNMLLKEIVANTKPQENKPLGRACIDPSKLQPGITPNPLSFGQIPLQSEPLRIKVPLVDFSKFLERVFKDLNRVINSALSSKDEDMYEEMDKITVILNNQLESYLADHLKTEEYSDLVNAIKEILVTTEIVKTIEKLFWDDLGDLIDRLLVGRTTFAMIFTQTLERINFDKVSFSYKSTSQADERCVINHKENTQRKVISFGTEENLI